MVRIAIDLDDGLLRELKREAASQGRTLQAVRAIASFKLQRLAARLRAEVGRTDSDQAAHTLRAADIKRFLERPVAEAQTQRRMPTSFAPPGGPIGDEGQSWLSRPPYQQ